MVDGDLDHFGVVMENTEVREKTVGPVPHGKVFKQRGSEKFQRAACVSNAAVEKRVSGSVSDFAADAFAPGITATGAIAAAEVGVADAVQQAGDIGGIVLAVGIEGDDPGVADVLEGGTEGGALSGVCREAQNAEFGQGFAVKAGKHLGAVVGGGVVDAEYFEGTVQAAEHLGQFRKHLGEVFGFVVDRKDGAEAPGGWGGRHDGESGFQMRWSGGSVV